MELAERYASPASGPALPLAPDGPDLPSVAEDSVCVAFEGVWKARARPAAELCTRAAREGSWGVALSGRV